MAWQTQACALLEIFMEVEGMAPCWCHAPPSIFRERLLLCKEGLSTWGVFPPHRECHGADRCPLFRVAPPIHRPDGGGIGQVKRLKKLSSSFLLLEVRPGALFVASLLLVAMPGAPIVASCS